MKLILSILFVAALAAAQNSATPVTLTWSYTLASASFNIYRAPISPTNDCAGVSWAKIAGPITATTYQDATLQPLAPTCYAVSAVVGKYESAKASTVYVPVPTGLGAQ